MGRRLRVLVTYDGADFHGWQAQRDPVRTAAGVLNEVISELSGAPVEVQGASRTDAGVHALGQVASFTDLVGMPDQGWFHRLNHVLPADIKVRAAQTVHQAFHPRHDAQTKLYVYQLVESRWAWPTERRTAWALREAIDGDAMRLAAAQLIGLHDFSSFRASGCQAASPIKLLRDIQLLPLAPCRWRVEVRGDSFMKYMVRNIVGALVEVGVGRRPPEWIAQVLAARDRRAGARTAPPHGLTLAEITYPGLSWRGCAHDDLDPPPGIMRPRA